MNNKEQEFKTIIEAIRFTERHYPEKVVIEETEYWLKVYSQNSSIFRNTQIIATVSAMKTNNHIVYDEDLNKVVLVIF